jgi:hypothetical protein
MEKEMAGAKIRDAYRHLNRQGIPTGPAPYVYVGKARSSGVLQPDPATTPIVQRIFELYADGSTPKAIAQTLTVEGIPSRSKNGWLPDTVLGMLGNIAGIARSYSESRRLKEGNIIPASWPPIISEGVVSPRPRPHEVAPGAPVAEALAKEARRA